MSLQGTLKTLGITEVLEFLSSRSASGRLDVTTEMGTASYALVEGSVSAAEYSFIRESGVDAAEATYYVVSELDGSFYSTTTTYPRSRTTRTTDARTSAAYSSVPPRSPSVGQTSRRSFRLRITC